MDKICDYIDDELMELEKKLKNGGKLSAGDIEMGDKLAHFKKSLLTNEAMEDSYSNESGMRRGYSRDYSMNDYSGRRDYSRDDYSNARRRDSMGRYSGDDVVHSMRELMNRTSDPRAKDAIRQAVSDIERG